MGNGCRAQACRSETKTDALRWPEILLPPQKAKTHPIHQGGLKTSEVCSDHLCAEGSSRQGEGSSLRVTTSSALLPSSPGLSILRAAWHARSPNSLQASEAPSHTYTCPRAAPLQATCYWNVSTCQSQLPFHCSRPVQRRGGYQSAGRTEPCDQLYHSRHWVRWVTPLPLPAEGKTSSLAAGSRPGQGLLPCTQN